MYSDEIMDVVYESLSINEGILDIFKKKKKPDTEKEEVPDKPVKFVTPKVSPKDACKKYASAFKKELNSFKVPNSYKIRDYKLTIADLKKAIKFEKIDPKLLKMEFDKYHNTFDMVYFHVGDIPKIDSIVQSRNEACELSGYCIEILYKVSKLATKAIGDNSYFDSSDGDWDEVYCGFAIKQK